MRQWQEVKNVERDDADVARVLVSMGANANALDDRHDTPWLVTGVTDRVPMLEVLPPANPDLAILNRFGGTSIIPASERGHLAYVQRTVQLPIDLNHVNTPGWTALLEAVVYGDGSANYQEIVTTLLESGADADGTTAMQNAQQRGQIAVAAVLDAHD